MRCYRAVLLAIIFVSGSNLSLAQSVEHAPPEDSAPSASEEAFETLKTLAGSWVGRLTTFPTEPSVENAFAQFSLRVTSRGHALAHEFSVSGLPDHPVSMVYLNDDRLYLTHYCDAGNRPRMVGEISPDGKKLVFEFVDLSGSNEHGHMHRAVFTFIDGNHHTEDWTYMMPGERPVRSHFDLQRTSFASQSADQ